jgi:transcriptional regulator with XRE-family HTH domain
MSAHVIQFKPTPAPDHFRDRLQKELADRCGRNPRYSLRAFANFLSIDHATLSQILRGKRAVTAATVRKLGARIGLTESEVARYIETVAEKRDAATTEYRDLAEDAARVFSDWHAFAILELMRLREFKPDVGWIERVLGVSASEIQIALQHLIRLGFLNMEAPDKWVDLTKGAILREEQFTMLSLERLIARSQALQAASARNASDDARFHGAVTVAVNADDLARLIHLAEKLLRDVNAGIKQRPGDASAEQLYHLEVHCFPISTTSDTTTGR